MSPHISTIPPGVPFLDGLARGLLARTATRPDDLARLHLMLPTRRAVRELTKILVNLREGQPLLLPRMHAVADVDDQELVVLVTAATGAVPDVPVAINATERDVLLAQMIAARAPDVPYGQLLAQARALSAFMNEVENEGLSLDRLDQLAPADFADHWQMTLAFLDIIRAAWPAILAERGQMNPAARRNLLLRQLAEFWMAQPPADPVIIAGVTGSLPAVAELMRVVAMLPAGEVILPGLDTQIPGEIAQALNVQHPHYELKRFVDAMGLLLPDVPVWDGLVGEAGNAAYTWLLRQVMCPAEQISSWADLSARVPDAVRELVRDLSDRLRVVEADTLAQEAGAVALAVRQALMVPDKTVSIITPDRALAQMIIHALDRYGIKVNDSAGIPLLYARVGRLFSLILKVIRSDFSQVDLLLLLQHPLLGVDEGVRHTIDRVALRGVRYSTDPDRMLADLRTRLGHHPDAYAVIERVVGCLRQIHVDVAQTPDAFAAAHIRVAEDLCGAEKIWTGEDGQLLSALLADILLLRETFAPVPFADYCAFFEHTLLQPRVNNEKGDDHPRVSLLGVYEARLSTADLIILPGFNEGIWPEKDQADPWFSRAMRRDFGLPPNDVHVGRMALDVFNFLTAPDVIITRSYKSEGTAMVPSRWLERLDTVMSSLGIRPATYRDRSPLVWSQQLDGWRRDPIVYPRPQPKPDAALRSDRVSATQVRTLIKNPYQYYVEQVLRVQPLDPHDMALDARHIGIILHGVLHEFARAGGTSLALAPAREKISEILLAVLDRTVPDMAQRTVIMPRVQQAIDLYLQNELERRNPRVSYYASEVKWSMPLVAGGRSYQIHARFDRVDVRDDGMVTLIDYKTGAGLPSRKSVQTRDDPQLPIEVMLVNAGAPDVPVAVQLHGVFSAVLWHVHHRSDDMIVWADDGGDYPLDELMDGVHEGLGTLLSYYADGAVAYEYTALAANMDDPYAHLARVNEWLHEAEEAE